MPHLLLGREGREIGVLHLLRPDAKLRGRIASPAGQGGPGAVGLGAPRMLRRGVGPAPAERGLAGGEEIAEQLALPAVPDAGTHGPDVRHGEDQEGAQAFGVLHDPDEVGHRPGIRHVPLLGEVRHDQVMFHQPRHRLDPRRRQAEALAGRARRPGAGQLLTALPALSGVVEQHGEEQDLHILDHRRDRHGQGVILRQPPGHDVGHDAHGPQGVLVHGVGVVHVELHLGHDPAEFRQIAPQDTGLVHQLQRLHRVPASGEDVEEDLRCGGIPPQPGRDQVQRPADGGKGVRMQVVVGLVRQAEQGEHVDRVVGEDRGVLDGEAARLLQEARGHDLAPAAESLRQEPGQALRAAFGLVRFQLGAEHPGQGAHLPGDQEIAAHEALDAGLQGFGAPVPHGAVEISHPPGDLRLEVEGQALLRPAGGVVQVRAHRPEEVEGAEEGFQLPRGELLQPDELGGTIGRMQILGDPEQSVQVPEAALALLDIGLDHVAGGAGPGVAVVPLLQLGGHEFGPGSLGHVLAEPAAQIGAQGLVPGEVARLQQGRADGVVLPRQADAFLDGAGGVTDLEAQIPQGVEHVLDDALRMGRLLVGSQEQQVHVGEGRQRPAAIAAHRQQGQTLPLRRVPGAEHVHGGEVVEGRDHLVDHVAQQLGGLDPPGARLQPFLGDHPAAEQGGAEDVQRPAPLLGLVSQGVEGGGGQLRAKTVAVDDVFDAGGAKATGHGCKLGRFAPGAMVDAHAGRQASPRIVRSR